MIEYNENIRDTLEVTSTKDKTKKTYLIWFVMYKGGSKIEQ